MIRYILAHRWARYSSDIFIVLVLAALGASGYLLGKHLLRDEPDSAREAAAVNSALVANNKKLLEHINEVLDNQGRILEKLDSAHAEERRKLSEMHAVMTRELAAHEHSVPCKACHRPTAGQLKERRK